MRTELNVLVARLENVLVSAAWVGLLTCSFCVLGSLELLVDFVLLFDVLSGRMIFWMEPWYVDLLV